MAVKINDQFWFDWSEELIKSSIERLDKGLNRLNTYIISLWAIYTGASIFSLDLVKFEYNDFYLIIVLPHLILLLGRWLIVQAQLPVDISFDPRIPAHIEKSYRTTYQHKSKWSKLANIITLIATLAVVLTLTTSFLKKSELQQKKFEIANRIKPSIALDYQKSRGQLIFTGEIPPGTTAEINIKVISETETIFEKQFSIKSSTKGLINGKCDIKCDLYGTIETTMSWYDSQESVKKVLIKTVNNLKPKKKK